MNSWTEPSMISASEDMPFLAQAAAAGNADLFADYAGWLKVVLARRGGESGEIHSRMELLRSAVPDQVVEPQRADALRILDVTLASLPAMPEQIPTLIDLAKPHAALAQDYLNALLRGDRRGASGIVLGAVESGVSIEDLYLHVFQGTQYEIGRLWQMNEISVAQEHFCTAATQLIISQLYPQIFSAKRTGRTVVATCVSGDLHELGIRMIADFFEMAGWDSFYLGASTPADSIIDMLIEKNARVLGVSATISHHVGRVASLIARVKATPECAGVSILVGGYPFNVAPDLWRVVGADGHARDASTVVALADRLTGQLVA